MAETSIEWTDATWNPVAGWPLFAGLHQLLPMKMAARLARNVSREVSRLKRGAAGADRFGPGRSRLDETSLETPRSWSKPRRIFVNSMSDLFHEAVPAEFVARVWQVMGETPRHTYQILTKRPARMAEIVAKLPTLNNVWLGTSVEK